MSEFQQIIKKPTFIGSGLELKLAESLRNSADTFSKEIEDLKANQSRFERSKKLINKRKNSQQVSGQRNPEAALMPNMSGIIIGKLKQATRLLSPYLSKNIKKPISTNVRKQINNPNFRANEIRKSLKYFTRSLWAQIARLNRLLGRVAMPWFKTLNYVVNTAERASRCLVTGERFNDQNFNKLSTAINQESTKDQRPSDKISLETAQGLRDNIREIRKALNQCFTQGRFPFRNALGRNLQELYENLIVNLFNACKNNNAAFDRLKNDNGFTKAITDLWTGVEEIFKSMISGNAVEITAKHHGNKNQEEVEEIKAKNPNMQEFFNYLYAS